MKVLIGITIVVVMLAVCSCTESENETDCIEPQETELHRVALSVASLMADPTTPIHSLANVDEGGDPRILDDGVILCDLADLGIDTNPDAIGVGKLFNATNDLTILIRLDNNVNGNGLYIGDNEAKPLFEYSYHNETENWYCVEEDGTTHGWLGSDGRYIENL